MQKIRIKVLMVTLGAFAMFAGLMNAAIAAAPNARIVVAKSGGNYTTITAALNAIVPSATKPYTIEVWPGTYAENVTMKSYVHLKGLGRGVTYLKPASGNAITMTSLTNVAVSGLSIILTPGTYGIYPSRTVNAEIVDCDISNGAIGVYAVTGSSVVITGNTFNANQYFGLGIESSTAVITNNVITGNGIIGQYYGAVDLFDTRAGTIVAGNVIRGNNNNGITVHHAVPSTISNNTITDNLGYGLNIQSNAFVGIVNTNNIVNNGGTTYTDIFVADGAIPGPTLNLNIYDDITGTRGVGGGNYTSAGGPAPAP